MKKMLLKRGSKEHRELEIKLVNQGYRIVYGTRYAQVWIDKSYSKNYSDDSKIVIEFYGF